jgi:hypothetical protein
MSDGRVTPPAAPQASQVPGYPSSHAQILFETFNGIDTKSPRPAVPDQQMAWCRGFMPTGPSQLSILPGKGPNVFTSTTGIVWYGFGNIADTYYAVILQRDGSIAWFNTDTGASGLIMPPGAILVPRTQMGFTQWGSQYFIFAKDQANGYWIWDGTNLFTAGTLGPIVNLTNAGSNYIGLPAIQLLTTGNGTGVQLEAQLVPGTDAISQITVTNPGHGFAFNDLAILAFVGGGSDNTAIAAPNISAGGGLITVDVTNGGGAYTYATTVSFTGGGGSGAAGAPQIQGGVIVGVTIINAGIDYTSPPDVVFEDPGYGSGSAHIGGGSGATAVAQVGLNGIDTVPVAYGGTGYTSIPTVDIIGDGSGASVHALIADGQVSQIVVDNTGSGYTKALAKFTGGNNAAAADPIIMPFGWSGTSVEVYQSRVWISNGAAQAAFPPRSRLIYSAPENPCDPGNGGGALLGTDSFLRVGWYSLKQTNGYLYLMGDSSVNSIGNVITQTVGATQGSATTPATPGVLTTTFSNLNVDPQTGTPWPSSVQLFNRNIIMANTQGIQVSYGGAVQKISAPLDGIFFTGPIYARDADFSSAMAQIFGIQVYCLLVPFIDPITNALTWEMIMWDFHRFWSSQQEVPLTYIASQEIESTMTAWGTDGTNLFRLFQQPSIGFSKVVQSKLWAPPGYDFTKTGVRLYGVLQNFSYDAPLEVAIDTDAGAAYSTTITVDDGDGGTDVFGPYPVGQQGKLVGFTATTSASSGELLSLMLREQDFLLNT